MFNSKIEIKIEAYRIAQMGNVKSEQLNKVAKQIYDGLMEGMHTPIPDFPVVKHEKVGLTMENCQTFNINSY